MSIGARTFVGAIFFVLGLSFLATLGALYYEFGVQSDNLDWFGIATFYSHLFLFFPTFGIVALIAFYVPSVVFSDMYWKHVPFGRVRFLVGFGVVALISVLLAGVLNDGKLRSIWEVKPDVLSADQGVPAGCAQDQQTCTRAPILSAAREVRDNSQLRIGVAKFVRNCKPDDLVEVPAKDAALRYCFVTRSKVDAATCCRAQKLFVTALGDMFEPEANRSLTGFVHRATLPLKIFFLLVVFVVAVLLAARRQGVVMHYNALIKTIERGVLVGAFAMLFFPIMNMAFIQTSGVLYGTAMDSVYRSLSIPLVLLFGAWALLILFFFFRDADKEFETIGRIAGLVGSALAVMNYETITDHFVRFAGSGADEWSIIVLIVLALGALVAVLMPRKRKTV